MTPPTTTWKGIERDIARVLRGQRIPSSGNGALKGDVHHAHFLIESKYGKQVPKTLSDWYAEASRDAATEKTNRRNGLDLLPILVTKRPRDESLVTLSLEDFAFIADLAGLLPPDHSASHPEASK